MLKKSEALKKLLSKIKYSKVLLDEKSLFKASIDNSRFSFLPEAVVKIKNENDVGIVLKLANETKTNVTVRGAGTGCCAGCVPQSGGWVIDLSEFNDIKIDTVSRCAHVQAGAITYDIYSSAKKENLFYPPDPSSHKFSTIGGNIACDAGGLRACKYGTTRDYVMALSCFLPTGEKVNWSLPLKKFTAGLNLRDLLVSSEGTLGVITKASLKLLPLPEMARACAAMFPSDSSAIRAVEEILKSTLNPSVLEFLDTESLSAATKYKNMKMKKAAMLLMEFDGSFSDIKKSFAKIKTLKCGKYFQFSKNEKESEKLWEMRRICSQASYMYGDIKLNQDIVLPSTKVSDFFDFFKSLCKDNNLYSPTFGHAGDGNYHLHIMYFGKDKKTKILANKAMEKSITYAIKLGGAISGEHGIGLLKLKYMKLQHTDTELSAMRKIKQTLDPNNILNAQKVLGDFDIYKLEPLKNVILPWDKK